MEPRGHLTVTRITIEQALDVQPKDVEVIHIARSFSKGSISRIASGYQQLTAQMDCGNYRGSHGLYTLRQALEAERSQSLTATLLNNAEHHVTVLKQSRTYAFGSL